MDKNPAYPVYYISAQLYSVDGGSAVYQQRVIITTTPVYTPVIR
jgi:hypothetical protein